MTVPGSANPLLLRSAAPTAYQVSRSLRFNSADSAYLSRTPGSAGNRKTWTWSGWVKRTTSTDGNLFSAYKGSGTVDSEYFGLEFTSDSLRLTGYSTNYRVTTQVFRDYSAWYHIVVATDTTNATASDRFKIYVNGAQVTTFSTTNNPALNADLGINQASEHTIGRQTSFSAYFNGYLANVEFVDGSALTPSSFAETDATTGQWVPKLFSGSYGSQGWKLTFADNSNNTASTLGADSSGNGNNWTPNNLSVTAGAGNDALTDSPTSYGSGTSGGDVRGNFCTLNPLSTSSGTYSQGNLSFVGANSWMNSNGTFAVSTGKWYYEVTVANAPYSPRSSTSEYNGFGWGLSNVQAATTTPRTQSDALMYGDNGYYKNFSGSNTDGGAVSAGDVLAVAVDLDANTFYLYKNNSQIATGTIGGTAGRELTPRISSYNGSYGALDVNFGQRAFAYTPPANHKPLVDTYLPTPTVAKPNTVMDVKLYSGNSSTQSVTGLGFSPDFVWIKSRSNTEDHVLSDVIRGTNTFLYSNLTLAEGTSYSNVFNSFDSTGFSLGYNASFGGVNVSGRTYVAWAWDAGTTTSSNTQGSITSSVRANASAGFSIVTWTGNGTVGHGLGVAPVLYIWKRRNLANNWGFNFTFLDGSLDYMYLNLTNAKGDATQAAPTSTVITIPSGDMSSTDTGVLYAFSPVSGYSSAFSYTGNGSSDGPMVYLGFRPKFILQKRTDAAGSWLLLDTSRDPYNAAKNELFANSSIAEYTNTDEVDFLSNGFKVRCTFANLNASGGSFIGYAFAENPFQYARAR